MSTSSSAKRGRFWRSDWFAAVLVVAAVIALQASTHLVSGLERRFDDFASMYEPASDTRKVTDFGIARFRAAVGAQVMAAGNAFVSSCDAPGYDASQKDEQAPGVRLDEISVMNKSGAAERPRAGGGNTGREP